MTALMLLSVFVGVIGSTATAEVADGTSTTGPDRNPTAQEQDGASLSRTQGTSVQSDVIDAMTFTGDHTMAFGTATTQNTNTDMTDYFVRGCSIDLAENMLGSLTSGTATAFSAHNADDYATTTDGYGSGLKVDITTTTTAGGTVTELVAAGALADIGTGYAVGDEIRVTKAALIAGGNTAATEDIVWTMTAAYCENDGTLISTAHNAKNRHSQVTAGANPSSNIDVDITGNAKTTVGYHGDTYSGTDNSVDPAVAAQSGFVLGEVEFFDDAQRTTKKSTDAAPTYSGDCYGAAVTTCDNIMDHQQYMGDMGDEKMFMQTQTNVHSSDMNTVGFYYEVGTGLDPNTAGELTTSQTSTVSACNNGALAGVATTTYTGTGSGAMLEITCASNAITIATVMQPGQGYKVGDIIYVTEAVIDAVDAVTCSAGITGVGLDDATGTARACLKYVIKAGDLTDNMRDDAIGFDITFAHNYTVLINGAGQTVGDAKGLGQMDTIVFRADNTTLQLPDITMTMPTAYDYGNQSDILNSSTRINIVSKTVVHFTTVLDIAADKDCTLSSDDSTDASCNGVIWDPAFTFGEGKEPGIRVGNIENGAGSWCDAKWWFASCGSSISVDGNTSKGMDGAMIKYTIPASVMYSQASWGGWEKAELVLKHSKSQCFNGEITAYMVAPSQIGNFRTEKGLASYLLYGDYYNYTAPTSGYSIGSEVVGSPSSDYCFTASDSTKIHLTGLDEYTGNIGMYSAYEQGFYDFNTRMFTFYILLDVKQTRVVDAAGTDEFEFETDHGASNANFAIEFTYVAARNALSANDGATRTTNNTNDTSPNFASPYAQFYHVNGVSALMAGNNGSHAGSVAGGVLYDTAALSNEIYSTFECGANVHGGSIKSVKISMYIDTNFTGTVPSWQPYGTINSNGSQWAYGPVTGSNPVDNTEEATTSEAASFTGVFTNGETYKASCETVYWSYDIHRTRMSTITMNSDTTFTPMYNAMATGSGAVDDDDDYEFTWGDALVVIFGFGLIFLGLYMWRMGGQIGWRDERVAYLLLGIGALHAWASTQYGPSGTGYWDADEVELIGSLGYLVMTAGAWLWAMEAKAGDMNLRNGLAGLFLIVTGLPEALSNFGIDSDAAADAMWIYPVYPVISAIGAFVGVLLVGNALWMMWNSGSRSN